MKVWPLIMVIFIVVTIFSGLNEVGQESITNSNLDNKSKELIVNINTNLNNNFDDLTLPTSDLTVNSTFEGQDPFVQQFLETKEQTGSFEAFVNKIISIPDLLILGINDDISEETLSTYKIILSAFILLIIVVVSFVAIFGDGRIT
jgi:hypothetical protein